MASRKSRLKHPEQVLHHILHRRQMHTVVPGVLTVACYANFYPVCYRDAQGRLAGLDVDIMRFFCRITGLKLQLVEKKHFDGVWLEPAKGRADIAIGGIGTWRDKDSAHKGFQLKYTRSRSTEGANSSLGHGRRA